jgi:hypothetical protein
MVNYRYIMLLLCELIILSYGLQFKAFKGKVVTIKKIFSITYKLPNSN